MSRTYYDLLEKNGISDIKSVAWSDVLDFDIVYWIFGILFNLFSLMKMSPTTSRQDQNINKDYQEELYSHGGWYKVDWKTDAVPQRISCQYVKPNRQSSSIISLESWTSHKSICSFFKYHLGTKNELTAQEKAINELVPFGSKTIYHMFCQYW